MGLQLFDDISMQEFANASKPDAAQFELVDPDSSRRSFFDTLFARLLLVLSLMGAATFAILSKSGIREQQILTCVQPLRELGRLRQGAVATADFELVNESDDVIYLSRIQTSCDCTGSTLSGNRLNPGESCSVSLSWRVGTSRGRSGTEATVFYKVESDGSAKYRTIDLHVVADVVPDYSIEPRTVRFDYFESTRRTVTLTPVEIDRITISKSFCTSPHFRVISIESEEGSAAVVVQFDKSKWKPGASAGSLVLYTNSEREPTTYVPFEVIYESKSGTGKTDEEGEA